MTIAHDWKENAVGDGENVGRGLVALDESRREGLAGSHPDPLGDSARTGENGSGQGAEEACMTMQPNLFDLLVSSLEDIVRGPDQVQLDLYSQALSVKLGRTCYSSQCQSLVVSEPRQSCDPRQ